MNNTFNTNRLLVICGPTATGKTQLALQIAKKFHGEIISADSRQVYTYMDIGTGKDLPLDAKKEEDGSYVVENIRVWGYDLVVPTQSFSVAHYQQFARGKIEELWKKGVLPILTGGTGFYIKAVVEGIDTIAVPQDTNLRSSLDNLTVEQLFARLNQLNPQKAQMMNQSDKKNPRRLIRAIEVASATQSQESKIWECDVLMLGLKYDREVLKKRIEERVQSRVDAGIKKEISFLLSSGVSWSMPSMQALGYRQWRAYFEGIKTEDEVKLQWINDEIKYAKRQMTWFKKDKRIQWCENQEKRQVVQLIGKWYKG